ncbi:MAG: hypothetical protein ACI3XJ_12750 [Oscillospiraceae bacterium]
MSAMVVFTIFAVLGVTAIVLYILRSWGLESMLILFVAISAAGWGWVIRWLWKDGRITLSHILVIWMVWTGTVLSGASYYLAYRGLSADLETLSRYIMVEVVAGVGGYFVKSGIENVVGEKSRSKTEQKADDTPKDLF